MTDLTAEIKEALESLGARARKSFGQNFMISESALAAIREASGVEKGGRVIEIGPGLGFLTRRFLADGVTVTAVEKDRLFVQYLKKKFAGQPLRVVEADILTVRPKKDLELTGKTTVVGNIPYNITSPILGWLVDHRKLFPLAVLTVQKEVAERLAAEPDTESWGALSVFIQLYCRVSFVKEVPKSAFIPPPRVDSAVIRLEISETPLVPVKDEALMLELAHRAFQKRRKTVQNALEKGDKPVIAAALEAAGIDPRRRPETLTLAEWAGLSDVLGESRRRVI